MPIRQYWVLDVKRQREAQDGAFFFKQWDGWGADGKEREEGEWAGADGEDVG